MPRLGRIEGWGSRFGSQSALTEEDEAAVLTHHTGSTAARTLRGTGFPRRAAVGAVELPLELVGLLPGDERAPVRGTHGEHAGPHAGPPGRLGFRRRHWVALAVEVSEVDLPPSRPDRQEAP